VTSPTYAAHARRRVIGVKGLRQVVLTHDVSLEIEGELRAALSRVRIVDNRPGTRMLEFDAMWP
jgi:hypothetical protein